MAEIMIQNLLLEAIPNQRFGFVDGDNRWEVRLFVAIGSLCADIHINGEPVILATRVMEDDFIIPYAYLSHRGNLLFSVAQNEEQDWQKLGSSQQLYFFSADEFTFND